MTKLYAMMAYSGAGKSTEAKRIARKTGAVIVGRDPIRHMLLAGNWWTGDKRDEERVTIAERSQVAALLKAGVDVIVDNTHINPKYLRHWARLATQIGVDFEIVDVHSDIDTCKTRAWSRWRTAGYEFGRYVDPEVIEQQAKRWPVESWPTVEELLR